VEASRKARAAEPTEGKEAAWETVREAEGSWAAAMRAHKLAPPDPEFRARLRALSEAAAQMRDAHTLALEAGLAWRPIEGSDRARPPYELRPGTGRRGPEELWAHFDHAVERLNGAAAGDDLAEVVAAYSAVAESAGALADALEAAGE
jgi:hypothetical protein